jgi:hypothetical protein
LDVFVTEEIATRRARYAVSVPGTTVNRRVRTVRVGHHAAHLPPAQRDQGDDCLRHGRRLGADDVAADRDAAGGPDRGSGTRGRRAVESGLSERRLTGENPGQAPFLVRLEEAQLLRRVRHQEVLRLLVVHA